MVELEDISSAARVLDGVVHRTPVLTSRTLDELTGCRVLLKPEQLQRGGAFKLRGAFNKVASLEPSQRARGVFAFSSGNHAQGVAIAAAMHGAPATILMPSDAPASKLAATRGYGAEVITYDRDDDRELIGREIARDRGLALVHPYDDPLVIAGQGTATLELIEDGGGLDVLLTPVGGGGLLAGSATVAKALCPDVRVFGAEPEFANDTALSLAAGERVAISEVRTIADALGAKIPGEITFPINLERVDGIIAVSDAELIDAMRFAFERLKQVLEPGGSAALAALLSGRIPVEPDSRVGVILSGGNVDPAMFARLMADGSQHQA
jgi:threo-3-hydroxy-L-aspartate ammonia-lyase